VAVFPQDYFPRCQFRQTDVLEDERVIAFFKSIAPSSPDGAISFSLEAH